MREGDRASGGRSFAQSKTPSVAFGDSSLTEGAEKQIVQILCKPGRGRRLDDPLSHGVQRATDGRPYG